MNFRYYKTERLIALILVLAIFCSYISDKIEHVLVKWELISRANNWIDTFSTVSLIIFIFIIINRYAWKFVFLKWLIDIPDLNGRYSGMVISSYLGLNGEPEKKECVIEIKQTASAIHIFAYFGDFGTHLRTSRSHSVSEQLVKESNGLFLLYYIFTNETEALQVQLNNHLGTARLKFYPDTKTLDGEYYNQRKNIGTIEVQFLQKKLLGRLVP